MSATWAAMLAVIVVLAAGALTACQPDDVYCGGKKATIVGSTGNDVLNGTAGDDVIVGGDGNDTIDGKAGNDTLCGDRSVAGNDTIIGGTGSDWVGFDESKTGADLDLAAGTSRIQGDDTLSGIDNVYAGPAADIIYGNSGANRFILGRDDFVEPRNGDDVIQQEPKCNNACRLTVSYESAGAAVTANANTGKATGGDGNDTFEVTPSSFVGSAFNDTLTCSTTFPECYLFGRAGQDTLNGGPGDDALTGGPGNDRMVGGGGVDTARFDGPQGVTANLATGTATGQGTDTLIGIKDIEGSSADDNLVGAGAPCELYGGRGNDTLRAGPSGCLLQGSDGNDKLYGGAGIDRIEPDYQNGPAGADVVDAGGADDSIEGDLGADQIDGGSGRDSVSYGHAPAAIKADLRTGSVTGGWGPDTLLQVENLSGTNFSDTLTGNDAANTILASSGDDTVFGNGGDDYLDGSYGTDWLHGGSGPDFMDGGPGPDMLYGGTERDILAFRSDGGPVNADLSAFVANTPTGQDRFLEFEDLIGSDHDDVLTGDAGPNTISGGSGVDTCNGNGGSDNFIDCP